MSIKNLTNKRIKNQRLKIKIGIVKKQPNKAEDTVAGYVIT